MATNKLYATADAGAIIEVYWYADGLQDEWRAHPIYTPENAVFAQKAHAACQEIIARMARAGVLYTEGIDIDDYADLPGTDAEQTLGLQEVTLEVDDCYASPTADDYIVSETRYANTDVAAVDADNAVQADTNGAFASFEVGDVVRITGFADGNNNGVATILAIEDYEHGGGEENNKLVLDTLTIADEAAGESVVIAKVPTVTINRGGSVFTDWPTSIGVDVTGTSITPVTNVTPVAGTGKVPVSTAEWQDAAEEVLVFTIDGCLSDAGQVSPAPVTPDPGALDSFAFTDQPANEEINQVIPSENYGDNITVTAYDAKGNVKTDYTGQVDMTISNDPPTGSTLGGDVDVAAVAGVATFTDLTINQAGAPFRLTATDNAGGVVAAESDGFEVF